MRKYLILLLLSGGLSVYAQSTPAVLRRIASSTTVFVSPLTSGSLLGDINTGKTYRILRSVVGTAKLSDLSSGTDYIEFSTTSHTDVVVDGDFTSQGIMLRGASAGSYSILTDNSADWNTAYGWGNHASAGYVTGTPWTGMGYLTSQTSHTDVVVDGDFTSQGIMLRGASAGSYSILTDNSADWNTAYGWGNHASAGYVTGTPWTGMGYLTSQISHTDVVVDGDFTSQGIMLRGASAGSYSILTDNSADWNTAFGWGNPSGVYLPLAGGTLTGGLKLNGAADGSTTYMQYQNNTSSIGLIGSDAQIGGTAADFSIFAYGNNNLKFYTDNVLRLTVSGAGAATFTGSLAASNLSGTNTGDNAVNSNYSGLVTFPGFGTSHITAAYGDHAHSGVYVPVAHTSDYNHDNFTTAYGWGDHAGLYLPIGGGTLTGALTIDGAANGTTSYTLFKNNGTYLGMLGSLGSITGGTATDMGLYLSGATSKFNIYTGDNTSVKFSVTNDGHIGIGVADPDAELEVNGTTHFGSYIYTWPTSQTANYFLKTDGSGGLSWASVAASNVYLGTWLADNSSPVLDLHTGTTGNYYRVISAATWEGMAFSIGDDIMFDGVHWQRIPGSGNYTLPVSTASVLGGVKIGSGVSVAGDGTISVYTAYASTNQTMYIGTTGVAINRGSGTLNLTGVNIDGFAATATNALGIQGGTNDVMFGNSVTTGEYMKFYYGGGTGYVDFRYDGTSVATTASTGWNLISGMDYRINGSPIITSTITDGVTLSAPNENVVFDALALKAPVASPTFTGHITTEGVTATGATGTGKFVFDTSPTLTGTPLAPTASVGTNTTQIATTAYVTTALSSFANVLSVEKPLSAANILALYDTPIEIVPTPGLGYAIEIVSASMKWTAGNAYTHPGNIYLGDGNGASSIVQMVVYGPWSVSPGTTKYYRAYIDSDQRQLSNGTNLEVFVGTQNPSGGTGTAKIYVTYRIITL